MAARIGLIGLGNAGTALLTALSRHAALTVFDRDGSRYSTVGAGCRNAPAIAESAASLAVQCDLVILSLPTPEASLAVGMQIVSSLKPDATVLETSTVSPDDVAALARIVEPSGARVIDAAIVGGVAKLAAGQGVFLIGSPDAESGMAGQMLRSISEELFFLPRQGDGMRAKIAVNAVSHAVYAVLVEAGALALVQGIPVEVYQRLLERESGLMRPLTHRFAGRLRKGDFAGGMPTVNARKDSGLALAAAEALEVETPTLAAAHEIYEKAVASGLGELDYASLGTLWEKALGISFSGAKD
jgi:3-hydroxyisobutyrate dehydrogenase-like beta-hydroxyacid dehydrogenase